MSSPVEPSRELPPAALPSNRSFGFVFTGFFVVVGVAPLVRSHGVRIWALVLALFILAITFLAPAVLLPFNRLWAKFGDLLHRLVSPIILAILFFAVVTPTGFILRIFGRDILALRRRPDLASYWVKRDSAIIASDSFKNQF